MTASTAPQESQKRRVRTSVYVDGFNLYYGALKGRPCKWLNLAELCRQVLQPHHDVQQIRYFTAHVKSRPSDPNEHVRQQTYLRALRTLPSVSIHLGSFTTHKKTMPRADGGGLVEVLSTSEKGSDVNLATFLLADAFRGCFEAAVVISNDSDLAEPIRVVNHELKLPVGILNPHPGASVELKKVAKYQVSITATHLQKSVFANDLSDSKGPFSKPKHW